MRSTLSTWNPSSVSEAITSNVVSAVDEASDWPWLADAPN